MSGRPFEPFELSVLGAEGHLWLSALSEQGSVYGVPRPLPTFRLSEGFSEPVDWLKDVVGRARVDAGDDARAIGATLLDLVFGVPEIASLFEQTRGVAASRGAQVLFRVLAAPSALSAWPWELLLDPQSPGRFLTRSRDTHVVRAGRERTYPIRQAPITPPLNLLLVLSSPLRAGLNDDETPFDLYEEKRQLMSELQPLIDRGLLRVDVEDRPSVEQLRTRMGSQQRGYHIFHYLGHAHPTGLKLEQRSGRGRLLPSSEFSRLLQELPDLRLAVFAGCETARAPEPLDGVEPPWPGQLSTADHCIRDACPMVVGMQAVLPFGTEQLFTRYFYQALMGGRSTADSARLARLAIAEDEQAGGDRLNWAVPCLFVGGSDAGPLVDPDARVIPRTPIRRNGARLGVRQSELRFISRLPELRSALDVMSARNDVRLLLVAGARGTGKSAFLDRTLEELDSSITYLLVSATRLLDEQDPLEFLCDRVCELLGRSGRKVPKRGRQDSTVWWELLLELVTEVPFALVIDDADVLRTDDQRICNLRAGLTSFAERRGRARLALASVEELTPIFARIDVGHTRLVRLQALSWYEVWQWVRRNLPILTRFEESRLSAFYSDLPRLEDWEKLAEAVGGAGSRDADLPELVRRIGTSLASSSAAHGSNPPVFGSAVGTPATVASSERSPRVLRVAVAGSNTHGRSAQFARGITQFAAEHHVAGRVDASTDPTSRLAELVEIDDPFGSDAVVDTAVITRWLEEAGKAGADLILLDFGTPVEPDAWEHLLGVLAKDDRLLIATTTDGGEPTYPAWCARALAVGALDLDGQPVDDSSFDPARNKPDLYARETVAGSSLAVLVADETAKGPAIAAVHALGAAVLVWATDREQSAREVRDVLLETATKLNGHGIRCLDVDGALSRTRRQLLLDSLDSGALEIHELLAATGMRSEIALPLIEDALDRGLLRRVFQDGAEHYENPAATYVAYVEARTAPPGPDRTIAMDRLVDHVRELAKRGRYRTDAIQAMWESRHDGRRVTALGAIEEIPGLGSAKIVMEGISTPQSAFEQFHALLAAEAMIGRLTESERVNLRDAVTEQLGPDGRIEDDKSRQYVAQRILQKLPG